MATSPRAMPVTRPSASTVATASSLLDHVTGISTGIPSSPRTLASRSREAPMWTGACGSSRGSTMTMRGTTTRTSKLERASSLATRIVAVPGARAFSAPVASTRATAGCSLIHVKGRPTAGLPSAAYGRATSDTVCPTTSAVGIGESASVVAGRNTVMVA